MADPRLNPHSMYEAVYVLLKALKEGRLVAYATGTNDRLPVSYWKDKTVASIIANNGADFRVDSEEAKRAFPKTS